MIGDITSFIGGRPYGKNSHYRGRKRFGSRLSIDILARASLRDSTVVLCDTHAGRLGQVRDYVQRAIDGHKLPGKVLASCEREELLPDADCVVTAVSVGGAAYWGQPYKAEVEIPLKYGIHQTVADTIGIGGYSVFFVVPMFIWDLPRIWSGSAPMR